MSLANKFRYVILANSWMTMHHKSEEDVPEYTELIYISAVIYDFYNGKVVEQFSKHIKPGEDFVSWFCTAKTGIKAADVEKSEELEVVLEQFKAWIESMEKKKNIKINENCYFLCWDSDEFEQTLKEDSKRKKLQAPDAFNAKKICLKKDFLRHTEMPPTTNIQCRKAMDYVCLKFKGKETNLNDMASNTAKLAVRLSKFGCTLKINSIPAAD